MYNYNKMYKKKEIVTNTIHKQGGQYNFKFSKTDLCYSDILNFIFLSVKTKTYISKAIKCTIINNDL